MRRDKIRRWYQGNSALHGWCGSVDRALAWELKDCWFNPQPGHMPGLWAGSLVGGMREAPHRHPDGVTELLSWLKRGLGQGW